MIHSAIRSGIKCYLPLLALFIFMGCATSSSLESQQAQQLEQNPEFYSHQMPDDEGMWLLPQISGTTYSKLQTKGLALSAHNIYHPDSASLNQAIVQINVGESGGGTGSFVSENGLVLTNHHVAYDAIAAPSAPDQNYLANGFYADSMSREIPIENYSLHIPIEQTEVTSQISNQLADTLTYHERQQQSQKIKKQLITQRKNGNNNLLIEINDFWSGNRQFMSVYKVINDVRLVHAPPESVGKYGGDIDNWQWPRHTGDYTFLRAYMGTNGNSASYAESNIPFEPARHLDITTSGVAAGDFTMVLGFPGQTNRHESSYAFEFYHQQRNPMLIDSYQAMLDGLEYAANQDSATAIQNASQRASVANSLKYYRGVQRGFDRYNIIDKKQRIEQQFSQWIKQDSARYQKYRRVLDQLDQAYNIASQSGDLLYGVVYALNNNKLLQIANLYNSYYDHISDSTSAEATDTNKQKLLTQQQQILGNINVEAQKRMLTGMLHSLASLPDGKVMFHLLELFGNTSGSTLRSNISSYLNTQEEESLIFSLEKGKEFLSLPIDSARALQIDPMVKLYQEILDSYQFSRRNYLQHVPYMRPAQERYVQGMIEFRKDEVKYPDANSTLRLSGGHIHGYSPQDGIYYTPFTTFEGMLAKNTDQDPFNAPQQLEAYADSTGAVHFDSNPYATSGGKQIVNFLSTNDITGGNSGSPVLNGKGHLVGLAFDSNIEGVVGDYFYDPKLNRTISLDIRYILFLLDEFIEADELLKELDLQSESAPVQQSAAAGK